MLVHVAEKFKPAILYACSSMSSMLSARWRDPSPAREILRGQTEKAGSGNLLSRGTVDNEFGVLSVKELVEEGG